MEGRPTQGPSASRGAAELSEKDHGDAKGQCLGNWLRQLWLPVQPMRQAFEADDAVDGDALARVAGAVVVAGCDAALVDGPSRRQHCQSLVLTTLWPRKDSSRKKWLLPTDCLTVLLSPTVWCRRLLITLARAESGAMSHPI